MYLTNQEKALISYRHQDKIQGLFENYVHGDLEIAHFSINIFFGNGQSIFLSPTPKMAEELCKKNFVNEDSTYDPKIYKKLTFYPWRSVQQHQTDRLINFIKEEKFRMRSGIMVVRNLGKDRYVMYSVATHKKDNPEFPGQFYFLFHCKANYIAQLGDFLYNNLLSTINEYGNSVGIEMPKLNDFKPINLETKLFTDEQRELYDSPRNITNVNLIRLLKKKKPILRLLNGGRIENN